MKIPVCNEQETYFPFHIQAEIIMRINGKNQHTTTLRTHSSSMNHKIRDSISPQGIYGAEALQSINERISDAEWILVC